MYKVEWIGKDEMPGPLGSWIKVLSYEQIAPFCKETIEASSWIKVLSYEQIAPFCKETIEAGGIILRITKA